MELRDDTRPLTARSVVASTLLGVRPPELPAHSLVASAGLFGGNPKTTANECIQWKDAVAAGTLSAETIAHVVEDREKALRLIHLAEDACLVALSMRATVELEPLVTVAVTA